MKKLFLLALPSLVLTACVDRSGCYAGYVVHLQDNGQTQHSVQIDVGHADGGVIHCDVTELGTPRFLSSSFSIRLSGGSVIVDGLAPHLRSIKMKADKDSQCWRSTQPKGFACLDGTGFQFQMDLSPTSQLHFWTDKGAAMPRAPMNAAAGVFTVDQLRAMSVRGSFQNRLEYETLIQARKQAEISSRALAPRLTINAVANDWTGGIIGLSSSISELAPFLFPSNWYAAKSDARTAKATEQAAKLMKLDLALQVEQLASAITRDQNIANAYDRLLTESASIREEINDREQLGQYAQGSTDTIDSILNEAKQDLIAAQETVKEERRNLAEMVGLHNLEGIEGLDWSNEDSPISAPLAVNRQTMIERAVSRAPELAQIQMLIEAQQMKVKQSVWSWLDPNGGPTTGIGLANGAGVDLSRSQLRALQIQSEQVFSLIEQKMSDAADQLTTSERAFDNATTTQQINLNRKNQMFDRIRLGLTVDFFGLVQVLQDHLKTEVDVQNALASYRASKATVNRILLQGAYGQIK